MTGATSSGGTPTKVETDADFGAADDPRTTYKKWDTELRFAENSFHRWTKRAKAIDKRYKDEREGVTDAAASGPKQFNILWANTQLAIPAHWARPPIPVVEREFGDEDPAGRVASIILERTIKNFISHDDFFQAMEGSVQDRLLVSRGTIWARYVPHMETANPPQVQALPAPWEDGQDQTQPPNKFQLPDGQFVGSDAVQVSDNGDYLYSPPAYERVAYDEIAIDYVHWGDFWHTPARRWADVWWVAREVHMSKDEVKARFDNPAVLARMERQPCANRIPYNFDAAKDLKNKSDAQGASDPYKKCRIFEIWDSHKKEAIWICRDFGEGPLDRLADPLKLPDFFPTPRPCWGTLGTDSLEPIPDYYEWQDQAAQLDELTDRVSLLQEACKVAGAYNSEFPALERIVSGVGENRLVPVSNWAMFGEKGGVAGAISWLPIEQVAKALQILVQQHEIVKQQCYELSGYSDLMRANTDPGETYGAQQLKAKFGTLRLGRSQMDVQRFARDTIRIIAQIAANHLQAQTLIEMSGFDLMAEADPSMMDHFDEAIALLRSNKLRAWRIDIESDSTVALDEEAERAGLAAYLEAIAKVLPQMIQLVQQAPEMIDWAVETLKMMARKFRSGRAVEDALDKGLRALQAKVAAGPPAPQPDPKAQAALITAQASKQRADTAAIDVNSKVDERKKGLQIKEFTAVADATNDQAEAAHDMASAAFDLQHAKPGPGSAPMPPVPHLM